MKQECDSWDKLDQPIRLQVCRQQKGDIKCPGLVELIQQACRGKLDPQFGRIRNDQKENSFNRTYRVATIIGNGSKMKHQKIVRNGTKMTGNKTNLLCLRMLTAMVKKNGMDFQLIYLNEWQNRLDSIMN